MKQIRAKNILGHKALRGLFLLSFAALSMGGYFKAQEAIPTDQTGADLRQGGAIQLFYKIKKPDGGIAGWLIGNNHYVCVERDSFPQEINQAMDRADIGLIELKISESKSNSLESEPTQPKYLPEGITLPDLIGAPKAREIFNFIHHHLKEEYINTGAAVTIALSPEIAYTLFDIEKYSDFIRLHPNVVSHLLQILNHYNEQLQYEEDKDIIKSNLEMFYFFIARQRSLGYLLVRGENPLSNNKPIEIEEDFLFDCSQDEPKIKDLHIEKRFACSGRPVHSIETAKSQITGMNSGFLRVESAASSLAQVYDELVLGIPLSTIEHKPEFNEVIWSLFAEAEMPISLSLLYGADPQMYLTDRAQRLSDFLTDRQCDNVSATNARAAMDKIFYAKQQYIEFRSHGLEMDETAQASLSIGLRAMFQSVNELFYSCFPYNKPKNLSAQEERATQFMISYYKRFQEGAILLRDPKIAQTIISHLEDGEVFAAIGAGHLSGVIRHLSAQGLVVEPVRLSQPWNILGLATIKMTCESAEENQASGSN